jgi:hypothetical protein
MCKIIFVKKEIETREDMDGLQKRGEELKLRLFATSYGLNIEGYNGSCFCDADEGWRDAVETLVKEFLGEDYYIYFKSGIINS